MPLINVAIRINVTADRARTRLAMLADHLKGISNGV